MLAVAQTLALSLTHLYCGQGDWVWLKKIETGAVHNLRQSSTSILRKVGTGDDGARGGRVAPGTFAAAGYFYSPCLLFIHWITHRGCQLSLARWNLVEWTMHDCNLANWRVCQSQQLAKPQPGPAASKLVRGSMYNKSPEWPCLERQSGLEEITPACVGARWCTGSYFHVLFVDSAAQTRLCISLGFALCLQLGCLLEVSF